jgi:hypothetical protein
MGRIPKRRTIVHKQIISLAMSLALLTSAAAYAQSSQLMKVDVPFNFAVGNAQLPAGEYSVSADTNAGGVLTFQNQKAKKGALVLSHACESTKAAPQTELIFHRYGDSYFLSEVWVSGRVIGQQVRTSSHETEIARNNNTTKDQVVLTAGLK